jgi:hypothetical protein
LAVSSFVFAAAIGQYSNQQKSVEFSQGVRGLQSQLLSMISEVSSSFAPDISAYTCKAGVANSTPVFTAGAGDSSDCIYLGQAIGFGGDGNNAYCAANTSDQCSNYVTIPIVARRQFFMGTGSPVASLAQAMPLALASCTVSAVTPPTVYAANFPCGGGIAAGNYPNLAAGGKFAQNVSISKAFVRTDAIGTPGGDIGGFAFVFNLSNSSFSSTDNKGTVDLVYLPTFKNNTETKTINAINGLGTLSTAQADAQTNPQYGITLCVLNGFGKKSVITIGANSSRLDVVVEPTSSPEMAWCP